MPNYTEELQALLAPRSVVVVGASENAERISGVPLANLLQSFPGKIFAVNPRRAEVQGVKAFPSVADIREQIDCAIIVVPAASAVDALKDCAAAGVKAAVLLNAGFAELGAEGAQLQAEIKRIAAAAGMRLLGPNTTGLIDYVSDLHLTFAKRQAGAPSRRIAIVSQSGGFSGYIQRTCDMRGVPVAFSVASGNECDLQCSDFIAALSERDDIDIILVYLEGVRDFAAFRRSLKLAHDANKCVIALKAGTSEVGARAALAHTAAISGDDATYAQVFEETGVYRAYSVEEMVDVARAAATQQAPRGRNAVIVTLSGALGVHLSDLLTDAGFVLPAVPQATQEIVKALAPLGSAANPVDLTAQVINDPEMLVKGLDAILSSTNADVVVVGVGGSIANPAVAGQISEALLTVRRRYPHLLMSLLAWVSDDVLRPFAEAGLYVSHDAARAVKTLQAMTRLQVKSAALSGQSS